MPSSSVDPERLLALGAALEGLRAVAREGAEEVLEHFPELGERTTQDALDGLLEQLADTLRAVDAEATELAGRLHIAAAAPTASRSRSSSGVADASDTARLTRKGLFR